MYVNTKLVEFSVEELSIYRKKKVETYYMESTDIACNGERICVPTLEGNVEVVVSSNQYIMIGPCNDIYPIPKELFELRYTAEEDGISEEIRKQIEGLGWNAEAVKKCKLSKEAYVYAKEVDFDFAVYVKHCNSTLYGKSGDFYAVAFENTDDRYIINSQVMKETYELIGDYRC